MDPSSDSQIKSLFGVHTIGSPPTTDEKEKLKIKRYEEQITRSVNSTFFFYRMKPLVFEIKSLLLDSNKVDLENLTNSCKMYVDFPDKEFVIRVKFKEEHENEKGGELEIHLPFKGVAKMDIYTVQNSLKFDMRDYRVLEVFQEDEVTSIKANKSDLSQLLDETFKPDNLKIVLEMINIPQKGNFGENVTLMNRLKLAELKFQVNDGQFKPASTNLSFYKGRRFYPTMRDQSNFLNY